MNRRSLISALVLLALAHVLCGFEYAFTFTRQGPMPVLKDLSRMECFVPSPGHGSDHGGVRIPLDVSLTFTGSGGRNQIEGRIVIQESSHRAVLQATTHPIGDEVYCLPPDRVQPFEPGNDRIRLLGRPAGLPRGAPHVRQPYVEVRFRLNRVRVPADPFGLGTPSINIFNLPRPWPLGWSARIAPEQNTL